MHGKRLAIVQSSYIPWKGYFDLIRAVDEFVLLDDVQFTARDWRSRNRIKTKDGPRWLTVPVQSKGRRQQTILEAVIADPSWARRHWMTIQHAYANTPYFDRYAAAFAAIYQGPTPERLSVVNHALIRAGCEAFGISTPIVWSSQYHPAPGRNERLIDICVKAQATEYLSGPAARGYLDESAFAARGIQVVFADYSGYPTYEQPYPPFDHAVSALDLLFCVGPSAPRYMKDVCPVRISA